MRPIDAVASTIPATESVPPPGQPSPWRRAAVSLVVASLALVACGPPGQAGPEPATGGDGPDLQAGGAAGPDDRPAAEGSDRSRPSAATAGERPLLVVEGGTGTDGSTTSTTAATSSASTTSTSRGGR